MYNIKYKFSLSPFFVLLIGLFILIDGSFFAILLVFSATIHELSHIIAMHMLNCAPKEINIRAFGIEIVPNDFNYISYMGEIAISLAGPFSNLFMAGMAFFYIVNFNNFYGDLFFITVNMLFFIVNMLPIENLDGGRVFLILSRWIFGFTLGENVASYVSIFFSLILFSLGLWLLYITHYNFSLALVGAFLLIKQARRQPVNFFGKN